MEFFENYYMFFGLMKSLDEAFLARQGLAEYHRDAWGERFFRALDGEKSPWSDRRTEVYMAATCILYRFALNHSSDEIGPSVGRKPESFLKTVLMIMNCHEAMIEDQAPATPEAAPRAVAGNPLH